MGSGDAGEASEELNWNSENGRGLRLRTGAPLERSSYTGAMNHMLDFLSTASNEKLGAWALASGLVTYLVFGRFGLVLISVVAGILLHATWEVYTGGGGGGLVKDKENKRRKEVGLDVVARVLEWRRSQGRSDDGDNQEYRNGDAVRASGGGEDFTEFRPRTRTALSRLVDAVIRDYVQWWYEPILPLELSFPSACRRTLTTFILSISSHLSRKRPADVFLEFLTNASSIAIVFLSEVSGALIDGGRPDLSPVEAIEVYLQENPNSNLANMIDTDQQRKKLVTVADDILHGFLDVQSYRCEPARVFLREILAEVVLEMTIQSCSTPDWINDSILYLLEGGEPELMNAIDVGFSGAAADGQHNSTTETSLNVNSKDSHLPHEDTNVGGQNEMVGSPRTQGSSEETILESQDLSNFMPVDASERRQGRSSLNAPGYRANNDSLEPPASPQRHQNMFDDDRWTVEGTESFTSASSMFGPRPTSSFTSFDQIMPSHVLTALTPAPALGDGTASAHPSLQRAKVSILDDSGPGENVRTKPTAEFILQIEQASTQQPGWMITRKYADFENLHEVLRRISVVSGLVKFTEEHSSLPGWKGKRKSSLCEELERYLRDALIYDRLADCEGMKRFLSKDQGLGNSLSTASGNLGFGFPSPAAFETMGRGMIDVLASAPKGAAVGGKSLLDGVAGVLSGVGAKGQRKAPSTEISLTDSPHAVNQVGCTSSSELRHKKNPQSTPASVTDSRRSHESDLGGRSPHLSKVKDSVLQTDTSPPKYPLDLVRRQTDERSAVETHQGPFASQTPRSSLSGEYAEDLHLPPPPSNIPDDYGSFTGPSRESMQPNDHSTTPPIKSTTPSSSEPVTYAPISASLESADDGRKASTIPELSGIDVAMTENEIQITVELVFAVINELYTLSSAWNIRRTLLNAARTYLLRPGNPNLEAIRVSVQDSIMDPYTSDSGLAALVEKVRENALPTDEERKAWPRPPSGEAKESRRRNARKVLIERGMPQALAAIMGAAASGEALGRVFDCLQSEKVARGLVFHLLLQALKSVTQ